MYSVLPSFILGFHGCDQEVCDKIIIGKEDLKPSENRYDWLGHGIYFWEGSPDRALEYAELLKKNPEKCNSIIKTPAVIGAVIDLGHCLNLLESNALGILKAAYDLYITSQKMSELQPVKNKPIHKEKDILLRNLDCAVIESLHESSIKTDDKSYDAVRGVFWEGEELYPNAGFKSKNHIQVCVRNLNCIKGYFLPRKIDKKYPIP